MGYLLAGRNVCDKITGEYTVTSSCLTVKRWWNCWGREDQQQSSKPTAELQAEASCLCGQLVWGRTERGSAAGPKDRQPEQEERRRAFCAHQITIRVSSCTVVLLSYCCYSCDGLAVFFLRRTGFCLHDEQRLQNKSYLSASADCPH